MFENNLNFLLLLKFIRYYSKKLFTLHTLGACYCGPNHLFSRPARAITDELKFTSDFKVLTKFSPTM